MGLANVYDIVNQFLDMNAKKYTFHMFYQACHPLAPDDADICPGNASWIHTYHFLPEASFGLRVLSLPASVCVCVRQPQACPCHKSPRIQARTTKFGQKVQNNLVKVPIVWGGGGGGGIDLTFKVKFNLKSPSCLQTRIHGVPMSMCSRVSKT